MAQCDGYWHLHSATVVAPHCGSSNLLRFSTDHGERGEIRLFAAARQQPCRYRLHQARNVQEETVAISESRKCPVVSGFFPHVHQRSVTRKFRETSNRVLV